MNTFETTLREAENLLSLYKQQEITAQSCGFDHYIDMQMHFDLNTPCQYGVMSWMCINYNSFERYMKTY